MAKIYLVMEYDWESQTVLEAYLSEEKANRRAAELDRACEAKRATRPECIQTVGVEDVEIIDV